MKQLNVEKLMLYNDKLLKVDSFYNFIIPKTIDYQLYYTVFESRPIQKNDRIENEAIT